MKPRYTVFIKQPGIELRELCGALYMQWAKDAAQQHSKQQPWSSTTYYIYNNRAERWEWIGQIRCKYKINWERPKGYYQM